MPKRQDLTHRRKELHMHYAGMAAAILVFTTAFNVLFAIFYYLGQAGPTAIEQFGLTILGLKVVGIVLSSVCLFIFYDMFCELRRIQKELKDED